MGNVMFMRKGEIHTAPVGIPAFPEEPTSYELIETITASTTYIAPETGYYLIEDFGASGNGGTGQSTGSGLSDYDANGDEYEIRNSATGGGGGSGGYAKSIVKLNKGDIVLIVIGAVGSDTTVTINSTTDETYDVMKVTSGGDGGNGKAYQGHTAGATVPGSAGSGGVATGGNIENINGNSGQAGGASSYFYDNGYGNYNGGPGGSAVVTDGTVGGHGGVGYNQLYRTLGQSGFIKISAGNTNVA